MELHKLVFRIILLVTILALIILAVRFSGNYGLGCHKSLRGDGNLTRKEIQVKPFTRLQVSGSLNVYIRQDSFTRVEVLADSNLIGHLEFEEDFRTLKVEHDKRIILSRPAKLLVTVPDLEALTVEGASEITFHDTLHTEYFVLNIRGAGKARMQLFAKTCDINISGAGDVELAGGSEQSTFTINGAGKIAAGHFRVKNHKVKINGAGDARVFASDTLWAEINGAGAIEYSGNPHLLPTISGVGKIRARGE